MDTRSKYQRIFLIFNSEDIGYGVGQEPSGFVKIEVNEGKGKLFASVQNLNETRVHSYKLYLIKCIGDSFKFVCAGAIPMNKNRGELKIEIDPQDVCGSNVPVDEFNIAAIIGEDSKTNSILINCPLVAYKNGKLAWRDKLRTGLSKAREESVKNISVIALESEKHIMGNTAEVKEENEDMKSGYDVSKESEDNQENEADALEIIDIESADDSNNSEVIQKDKGINKNDDSASEIKNIEENSEVIQKDKGINKNDNSSNEIKSKEENTESTKSEPDIKQDDYDEYKQMLNELASKEKESMPGCASGNQGFCTPIQNAGEVSPCQNCKMFNANRSQPMQETKQNGKLDRLRVSLDKFFEVYDPFRSRRKDYRWWKVGSPVQLNNVLYQCDVKTPLLFNPALMMAHFKYRHIIVGIYSDGARKREYIVCGIPGVYNVDEKPFGNMCRWVQVEGNRPRYGAFGYWLVYIDGKTGKFLSLN